MVTPHIQSNHLSVTLICSTVRCTLGRSGDKESFYSQAGWLFNRENLESLLLTVLGSLTINGFLWEWNEFPQTRSYHVHCTQDMDSLPVMRSLTSRHHTLHKLRFCMKVYPIGIIYIYYHAKSGCYSFKIGQVMATSKLWNTFVYPSTLWCTLVHPSTL